MRCWKVRRLLSDYQDNELPEEQYLQVKEHLDRCQKCLQLLREYEAVTDIVVGVWKLERQNLPNEERDVIWGKVQAGIAVFKKRKPSMKMKISKWIREHIGNRKIGTVPDQSGIRRIFRAEYEECTTWHN